jgi:hypothetical protein
LIALAIAAFESLAPLRPSWYGSPMNKRALLYAGFLTAAVAVLLAAGKLRRSYEAAADAPVAANR